MTRLQETTTTAIIKSVTYVSGSNCHLCPRSHMLPMRQGRGGIARRIRNFAARTLPSGLQPG